jgi:hypothetical protein
LWCPGDDEYMPASEMSDQDNKDRYFLLGQWAMANLLDVHPDITVRSVRYLEIGKFPIMNYYYLILISIDPHVPWAGLHRC